MTEKDNPGDYHPVLIQQDIERLKELTAKLKSELDQIKRARDEDEKRRLRWGISALGTVAMALGAAVWALLPNDAQSAWQIFRGRPR